MKYLRRLWTDCRGYTSGISLVLVITILGLGAITGLATLRDQLNQELADIAVGLENLDQSFSAPCYGTFTDGQPSSPGADRDRQQEAPGCMIFERSTPHPASE